MKTFIAIVLCLTFYVVGAGGALALFREMGLSSNRYSRESAEIDRRAMAAFWPVTVPVYLLCRVAGGVADAVSPVDG